SASERDRSPLAAPPENSSALGLTTTPRGQCLPLRAGTSRAPERDRSPVAAATTACPNWIWLPTSWLSRPAARRDVARSTSVVVSRCCRGGVAHRLFVCPRFLMTYHRHRIRMAKTRSAALVLICGGLIRLT